MVRGIFGADRIAGEIYVNGQRALIRSPRDAVAHGIGYLPEDRKAQGLILHMPVKVNIGITALDRLSKYGLVRGRLLTTIARHYVSRFQIQPPFPDRLVSTLSGGNQQKVILSRWIFADSSVLIFDEPTRGVDVGAKEEIYQLIRDLAREGKAVIVISSELAEVMRLSDRILVMREGTIVKELTRHEATKEAIMYYATGGR